MNQDTVSILVVEDDQGVNALLRDTLGAFGYRTIHAFDGMEGLDKFRAEKIDLVITDVFMPRMNGFELCSIIKKEYNTCFTPVIILTGSSSREHRIHGINIGADEFLAKPFDAYELKARVSSLLKLKRFTDELENAEQVLFSLALTVAAKDVYTRGHCHRIAHNAVVIGRHLGLNEGEMRALQRGGFLHDIGKIAIPDLILQKQAALDGDEMRTMMEHPVKGVEICSPLHTLASALEIIHYHHERMDGNGYPEGIKGENISFLARIVSAVDLLDALITDRPYRKGLPLETVVKMLREAAETGHLDPMVVAVLTDIIANQFWLLMIGVTEELKTAAANPG
jgi:putative two-component system response regulator